MWHSHLHYRDSVFTICYIRDESDTCIYEALYHGSIPITGIFVSSNFFKR